MSLLPLSRVPKSEKEHRDLLIDSLATAHKIAADRNAERMKVMKERYHINTTEPKYKEGDLVLLLDPTKKKEVCKKLSDQFIGPFTVLESVVPVTFRLADMGQKSEVVHADRLKPRESPTKSSIRAIDHVEEPAEEPPAKKRTLAPGVKRKARIAAKDLVEKLHAFLEPEERETAIQIRHVKTQIQS